MRLHLIGTFLNTTTLVITADIILSFVFKLIKTKNDKDKTYY